MKRARNNFAFNSRAMKGWGVSVSVLADALDQVEQFTDQTAEPIRQSRQKSLNRVGDSSV
jgi:hypothetical protein